MGEQVVKNLLFLTLRLNEIPHLQRAKQHKTDKNTNTLLQNEEEKETLHWLFRRLSFLLRPKPKGNQKSDYIRVYHFVITSKFLADLPSCSKFVY